MPISPCGLTRSTRPFGKIDLEQLKISLQGAAPPLWRRLQIPTRRLSGLNLRTAAADAKPVDADYLAKEAPAEAEVFPVISLPPHTDLAAPARRVPIIDDSLRLAEWCSPGRPVTPKGVLKPAVARDAVEELRLWQRSDTLSDRWVAYAPSGRRCSRPPSRASALTA
jgi:hypothetical protein